MDALERRKPLYSKYVKKPANARKQAQTTAKIARIAIGNTTRALVAAEDYRLRLEGKSPQSETDNVAFAVGKDPGTVRRARKPRNP